MRSFTSWQRGRVARKGTLRSNQCAAYTNRRKSGSMPHPHWSISSLQSLALAVLCPLWHPFTTSFVTTRDRLPTPYWSAKAVPSQMSTGLLTVVCGWDNRPMAKSNFTRRLPRLCFWQVPGMAWSPVIQIQGTLWGGKGKARGHCSIVSLDHFLTAANQPLDYGQTIPEAHLLHSWVYPSEQ